MAEKFQIPTRKQLEARRSKAKRDWESFKPLLDEAYEYAIPYRKGIAETGKGEKRVNRIFDHTATLSAFRFAGRIQKDILPPGFFELAPGALSKAIMPREELEAFERELAIVSTIVNATFLSGEWDQAVNEMGVDLAAGTGAILSLAGNRDKPVRDICVPIDEVLLEGGPYNDITGRFWCRKWTVRSIFEEFPNAPFHRDMLELEKKEAEKEIELYQDTVWDARQGLWLHVPWCKENGAQPLGKSAFRTSPWMTPRYFRVPGETHGRGPILMAMPTIRTLNTAAKIALTAAAMAMLGVYTAMDDGVFSPDNAPLTPGAFWKVARNGGALGPSVVRLPDPRIDLNTIILNDLRMGVKEAMNDQALPPDGAAVRSATEILERVKRLASDHVGAFGRLVRELVVPAVQRRIEICFELGLLPKEIKVDQILVAAEVKAPMAMARDAEQAQKITNYIETIMILAPDRKAMLVKIDEAMREIGRGLSVPPHIIPTTEEAKVIEQQEAEKQAALAALAAAGGTTTGAAA